MTVESAALNSKASTLNFPPCPPGRPTLFTDALVDQICNYIQNTGVSDSAAGLLAGVSTTTLSRWKSEKPDFAILLEAARAELQRELIATVREARRRDGSSDWRGAAWLLERLFPEDFGRRPRFKSRPQSPEPTDFAPRADASPSFSVAPTAADHVSPTSPAATAIESAPSFPKSAPPEKSEHRPPKPTASGQAVQVSPAPAASDDEILPEIPEYLPTPRRFRCARITPGVAAEARARGHEPAEAPQLFPKSTLPPFPPSLTPEPSASPLFPKPNPDRPSPLAGPILPPAINTVAATAF